MTTKNNQTYLLSAARSLVLVTALSALALTSACASFAGASRPSSTAAGLSSDLAGLDDLALHALPVRSVDIAPTYEGQSLEVAIDVGRRTLTVDASDDVQKLVIALAGTESGSIGVQLQSWDGAPSVMVIASANTLIDRLVDLISAKR